MTLQARALDETRELFPVVLYFGSWQEADEFVKYVADSNGNLTVRKLE